MDSLKSIGVIPARYGSNRFPGKPLADIAGETLIERVYNRAIGSTKLSAVYVATDDERIFDEVARFGGRAVMTSEKHISGTDRIAEAVRDIDCDLVINIQGDEPLLPPELIDELVELFDLYPDLEVATAAVITADTNLISSPDSVKVVIDRNSNALYFSRVMIPAYPKPDNIELPGGWVGFLKHIGIYAFRREMLFRFTEMEPSPLEKMEKLEQLRLLENGIKIKVHITNYNPLSVDRPEDIERVISEITRQ